MGDFDDSDNPLRGLAEKLDAILARLDALESRAGPGPQRFFGVGDAARYSGLSPDSIRRMIARGDVRALRPVRGKVLIDRHELDTVILSSTARPRKGRGIRREAVA